MKIGHVDIYNFRSISKTSFDLSDGVTALAGGNESGKSNVLSAIDKFLNKKDFETSDKYQLTDENPYIEISFGHFTEDELEKLKTLFKIDEIDKISIGRRGNSYELVFPQLSKPEDASESFDVENTEDKDETQPQKEEVEKQIAVENNNGKEVENEKVLTSEEITKEILNLIPESGLIRSVESLIDGKNIPISDIYPTSVQDLEIKKDNIKHEKLETIRALLSLGGITEEIVKNQDLSARSLLLQTSAAKIAKRLRDSWTQEDIKMKIEADQSSLVIEFRDGKNRPEDKEDDTKWIWTLPEDRSTGFRWYVTFYVRYLTKLESSKNVVFLIDDAGAPLNKVAQEDLLNEFFKKANEKTDVQIIYSTHSKYMVNWDFRKNIRMIIKEHGEGTKVSEMWWNKYSPSERPAPLDEMGVTWADDFLKSHNLIVEGMIDVYLLHQLPFNLIDLADQDPYVGFKIVPAGMASLEKDLALLCKVNERKSFLLFDSDPKGSEECRKARSISEKGLVGCSQIKSLVGNNSTYKVITIEDLLPSQKYVEAFNTVASDHFKDRWSNIKNLGVISGGIEKLVFDRLQVMGMTDDEIKDIKKSLKFNIVKYAVDNTVLEDYNNPSQLKAVQSFFKNLKKRLLDLESNEPS